MHFGMDSELSYKLKRGETMFSGAFLDQASYEQLLQITDTYFDLDMMSKSSRKLPCAERSYMLIARDRKKVTMGLSKRVSMSVYSLSYNEKYGFVVGLIQMKKNFTCNTIPHIVIAKRTDMNNAMVARALSEPGNSVVQLYSTVKIRGKIGIVCGNDEIIGDDIEMQNGMQIHRGGQTVSRPETTLTVEQPLPEKKTISFNEFKTRRAEQSDGQRHDGQRQHEQQHEQQPRYEQHEQQPRYEQHEQQPRYEQHEQHERQHGEQRQRSVPEPDTDVIEINTGGISPEGVLTGEMFRGQPVIKGPRGGRHIMLDGKKLYVYGKAKTPKQSEVVYKVNMLDTL